MNKACLDSASPIDSCSLLLHCLFIILIFTANAKLVTAANFQILPPMDSVSKFMVTVIIVDFSTLTCEIFFCLKIAH